MAAGVIEPMQLPFLYPMRRAAAGGVALLSISLWALLSRRYLLAKRFSWALATLGAVALIAQSIRWSRTEISEFSVLHLFVEAFSAAFPNALSFLITGLALAPLAVPKASIHRCVSASIAGSSMAMLALCGLANELLAIIPANPAFEGDIAVDATVALSLLGLAIVAIAHAKAAETGEEVNIYRPVLVALAGTLAAFLLWRSLLEERSSVVAFQTAIASRGMDRAVRSELNRRLREVQYAAEQATPEIFQEVELPGNTGLLWTHSLASDDAAVKLRQLLEESGKKGRSFYQLYMEEGRPAQVLFATPMKSGATRFAVVPLYEILDPIGANVLAPNFQIFLLHKGNPIYLYPDPPQRSENAGQAEVVAPELASIIRLQPQSRFVRRGASWASQMVLAIGLNASFLLAFSAYLLHIARSRLLEVQDIRSGLEREIEQRKQAQADLAINAKQLETSNADLREFAHVASHDLQEPLRSITGFAQLLSRRYKGKLDEDADEFLDYISDASSRMTGMIQGLLAYSRLVHATDLDERFSLLEAVDWARSNLLLAIEESEACIEVGQLPAIRGNRLQFCQLMQNLIGNAIKYRGPDPPRIEITCAGNEFEHVVTVTDNGIGIRPEFQARIFGLFKRAHGNTFPGAGVGLSLCKKIIERHGGRIWVESAPGKGSRFHFALPLS